MGNGDTASDLTLILGDDNRFALSNARGRLVEGTYSRTESELVHVRCDRRARRRQFSDDLPHYKVWLQLHRYRS